MTLSQKDLSFIQKVGQAAHNASETIGQKVRAQGEALVANLSSQPFGAESDQVIERFKSLSSLSQGLAAVEAQLQKLYALANKLAESAVDVIVLKPVSKRKSIAKATAIDMVAKPAKASKKVGKVKKSGRKPIAPGALTANDSKLLSYLQGVLKADVATALTGAAMAACANLPLGSVGVSLKRLQAAGKVKMVGRGTYQLAAGSANDNVEVVAVKKVVVVAKQGKRVKIEKPAVKAAMPKVAGKAKAVAKKSKVTETAASVPTGDEAPAPV